MSCRCDELREEMLELHLSKNMGIEEMMEMVASFETPEEIFPLASSLKEQGNFLVKNGKMKEAMVIYKKAASFLVLGMPCCTQGHHPFRDLIIPITLNLALCALKLSNFKRVRRLCGSVLKFDTSNVKALYRRGSAAIGLGHLYDAKIDLLAARKIEPSNSEVAREWNRLLLLLGESSDKSVICSSGVVVKNSNVGLDVESKVEAHTMGFNPLNLPATKFASDLKSIGSESVGSNLDEISNLVGSDANFQQCKIDPPILDCAMEDSNLGPQQPSVNSHLAEPKRFSNQVRHGSFLTLSQSDYKKLAKGRTLNYSHPRLVAFISIKVVGMEKAPNPTQETHKCISSSSVDSDMEDLHDSAQVSLQPPIDSGSCIIDPPSPSSEYSIAQKSPNSLIITKPIHKSCYPKPHGVRKRHEARSTTRRFKRKVSCIPGQKRKYSSNNFITCYPLWKKKKISEQHDKVHTALKSDWDSFRSSSNEVICWMNNIPDTIIKTVGIG